jgi:hypothetical protein
MINTEGNKCSAQSRASLAGMQKHKNGCIDGLGEAE